MASLNRDSSGLLRIQFTGSDGKRRTIRLGNVSLKVGQSIKLRVEALLAHQLANPTAKLPTDPELARWLSEVSEELAGKLTAVGLIPERASMKLAPFLEAYLLARKKGGSKPATLVTIERVVRDLIAVLGADTDIRTITRVQAEQLKQHYQDKGLAMATIHRRLKNASMLFKHAEEMEYISRNIFAKVTCKNVNPPEKKHYISEADILRLMEYASPTWRTIISLARYAGLRCPSEVLSLKWEHVDFAANRMTVSSPKTEHLEGKAYRVVPIFARLRPYLEEAYELARPVDEYVVGGATGDIYRATAQKPGGWVNCNMRTVFEKLIRRAGLQSWPRLFHNLRASCETDLMQHHPIHVVAAWIGNTPKIALGHYLQTLESDFEKAVTGDVKPDVSPTQNATKTGADTTGREKIRMAEGVTGVPLSSVLSSPVLSCSNDRMGEAGLEANAVSPLLVKDIGNPSLTSDVKSDVIQSYFEHLDELLENWPALTPEMRAALLTIVKAGQRGE